MALDNLEKEVRTAAQLGQVRIPCRTLCLSPGTHLENFYAMASWDFLTVGRVYGLSSFLVGSWFCWNLREKKNMCKSLTFALQALLVRHEQYVHDAQRDRLELGAKLERLESNNRELEDQNAKTIKENSSLLDELEGVNGTLAESDTHIQSLETTLESTREEVRKLEGLASRTHDLEVQLAELEQEQELLQRTLVNSQEEERCAIQRWKTAERKLSDLQDQLERIEWQAGEEKERHVEIVGRMERQRALERQLDTAAGRLKGVAAVTAGGNGRGHVMSHFVKDILQDNANLQMGIMELREMLMNSNDEVQKLREELMMHQPMAHDRDGQATLMAEMASTEIMEPQGISQALHIHHHYHGSKKEETRRPKKKRRSLNTTLFTPPRISSPRTPRSRDTANTILSQTSGSIPSPITPSHNRWSMQSAQMSDFAPSSAPSSPQSMYRHSSIFDRAFEMDSSRPTSAGSSVDPMSPQLPLYRHRKRSSEASTRGLAAPMTFQSHVIHEEGDDDEELPDFQEMPSLEEAIALSNTSHDSEYPSQANDNWTSTFQPTRGRSTSHESIVPIAGLDLHASKSRRSQIAITRGNPMLRPRSRLGTPSTIVSVESITSSSLITARPTLSRQDHDSTSFLRSTISGNNSDARSISSSGSASTEATGSGVGTKFGGWVFGRWGVSPFSKQSSPSSASHSTAESVCSSTPSTAEPLRAFMARPPGINQQGPVPGFVKKVEKAPSQVKAAEIDHDALREVLSETEGAPS